MFPELFVCFCATTVRRQFQNFLLVKETHPHEPGHGQVLSDRTSKLAPKYADNYILQIASKSWLSPKK